MKKNMRVSILRDASPNIRYVDLFCGIGGFRIAADSLGWQCVFSSDIDPDCQKAYAANFGDMPRGDIHQVKSEEIPDHEILLAGFPCQPFSIIGHRKGFDDTRGTLFFEIARILKSKNPRAFVLENVKQLATHREQKTLDRILEVLREMGYAVDYKILNALDFGLPHKRERIFIVGIRGSTFPFEWPQSETPRKSLAELLEPDVPEDYYASRYIRQRRKQKHTSRFRPAIWHENKGGNVSSHPFSFHAGYSNENDS
jgi:DNA (cytosine-5)-methyltransferase 1